MQNPIKPKLWRLECSTDIRSYNDLSIHTNFRKALLRSATNKVKYALLYIIVGLFVCKNIFQFSFGKNNDLYFIQDKCATTSWEVTTSWEINMEKGAMPYFEVKRSWFENENSVGKIYTLNYIHPQKKVLLNLTRLLWQNMNAFVWIFRKNDFVG